MSIDIRLSGTVRPLSYLAQIVSAQMSLMKTETYIHVDQFKKGDGDSGRKTIWVTSQNCRKYPQIQNTKIFLTIILIVDNNFDFSTKLKLI